MPMDSQLLESLLHQEEGSALDFKGEQYAFDGADNVKKSELLKDILAFANSWRQTTAYILIGIEEVKGGRSKVIGVQTHLDDANLHQFVNHKTQRVVEFSYLPFHTDQVEIGVIEIPLQERPTFLKKSFGKLDQDTVYVRDSSSTRVAAPSEIAKMGAHQVSGGTPQLDLDWADIDNHVVLPSPVTVQSLAFSQLLPSDTFTRPRPYPYLPALDSNPNYSANLISYVDERAFFKSVGLRLRNNSGIPGRRIRFTATLEETGPIDVRSWLTGPPSAIYLHTNVETLGLGSRTDIGPSVEKYGDRWELTVDFGDIRPGQDIWTTEPLYVGSAAAGSARLEGKLLGDNLPEPIRCNLDIRFEVEERAMKRSDVEPFLDR